MHLSRFTGDFTDHAYLRFVRYVTTLLHGLPFAFYDTTAFTALVVCSRYRSLPFAVHGALFSRHTTRLFPVDLPRRSVPFTPSFPTLRLVVVPHSTPLTLPFVVCLHLPRI